LLLCACSFALAPLRLLLCPCSFALAPSREKKFNCKASLDTMHVWFVEHTWFRPDLCQPLVCAGISIKSMSSFSLLRSSSPVSQEGQSFSAICSLRFEREKIKWSLSSSPTKQSFIQPAGYLDNHRMSSSCKLVQPYYLPMLRYCDWQNQSEEYCQHISQVLNTQNYASSIR
jgi:hypothetical protein